MSNDRKGEVNAPLTIIEKKMPAVRKFEEQAEFNKWLRELTLVERSHVIDMLHDYHEEQSARLRSDLDEALGALERISQLHGSGEQYRAIADELLSKHKK